MTLSMYSLLVYIRYAKMQLRAFPNPEMELSFDDMVPKATSSRRVAAAAFYHCLGMCDPTRV